MAPVSKGTKTRPNIVFILTDNLDYGELSDYGANILCGVNARN
jgi:hypothetical protein